MLIERLDRPGQWNLVGGRIRRGEKIGAALRRHLLSTLGHGVSWARRGEATMHRWFGLEELPGRGQVGYDQADVL